MFNAFACSFSMIAVKLRPLEVVIENHILMGTNSVDSNMAPISPMIIPPSKFSPGDVVLAKF